ncbi:YlbD family protein [Litchfieldia salsa]|uniref:Putative coat protein n=1 Tax=Litchfieldia salsa TaxID=930152 RepID=A0A1H0RG80_9BACI|nr:YlbD family protein [Litchfieldia salsa]SDP28573.1 Putative coat protein [Litchfieldia salsa]
MAKQSQNPTIEEFKLFVKKHPGLIQEVRKGKKTWQEIYEDWYLLGENDDSWTKYNQNREESNEKETSKTDLMKKVLSSFKNVKMNDVQQQITNVGSAISTIQQVITQFQGGSNNGSDSIRSEKQAQTENHPFAFRKD